MSRLARVVVPSITLVLSALVLAFASQYRAERIANNQFLRGGIQADELDMLHLALQSPDLKLKKKAIEAATELALSGPFFSYLLELAQGQEAMEGGGSESEQVMAVTAIAYFAREESNRSRLIDNDVFDVFTTLLRQSNSLVIRENVAAGLMRLIRGDNERAVMLATCDIFPALLDILRKPTTQSNRLVHYVLAILHSMSKVAELVETLQAFDAHVVVCQFWRQYTTYKDFAGLSALIIQNMLELTNMERAASIMGDLGPHGIVPLSTSLLLSDNSQAQALTFLFYCAKNNLFIDQLVKRPYLVSTILTLIPSDSYSKALVAIVCLEVLCSASSTVTQELVGTNVISVIQPCLTRGTTLLKLASFKLVQKLLAGGTPIDKVLDSPNVLEHIVKLALTEPVAAELLWTCIEMDYDRRTLEVAGNRGGKPAASFKWTDSVLAGDKVQEVVVKMINATDVEVAALGLRAAALALIPRRIPTIASGLLAHGLFDSLRKCLLQSSSLLLVDAAIRMIQVLLEHKDVMVDVVHQSIAQVLVHNLLVRIPEVRDMLIKLRKSAVSLSVSKDPADDNKVTPKLDPVLLLSFETMQNKLGALLVVMLTCITNAELYALLKARQLFELKTIAQQAVWFIASFHNDHEDRCYVPKDFKEMVARVQKLQKGAAAKPSPLLPPQINDKSKGEEWTKFQGLWTQLVLVMSRLCVVMFHHDDLRQVLLKREFLTHMYLSYSATKSHFFCETFCTLIIKLPVADIWRDYHEAIRDLYRFRLNFADLSRVQYIDLLLMTLIVPATRPARTLMYDPTRKVTLIPYPVSSGTSVGPASPHMYADCSGAYTEIPSVFAAHVIASYGVRGSLGGKWGFSVRLNDVLPMAPRVGFISADALESPFESGAQIGDTASGFSVNWVDGFKHFARAEPFVFKQSWDRECSVQFLLDLDQGHYSICLSGSTMESATTVFDDLPSFKGSDRVWFPIMTANLFGMSAQFDPTDLPAGYRPLESCRRQGLLVPISEFVNDTDLLPAISSMTRYDDLPTYAVPPPLPPSPTKPTTTFSMDSASSAPMLATEFSGHLYYELEADWPLPSSLGGPGSCALGWRVSADRYLVWYLMPYAGLEAIVLVPDLATLSTIGQEQIHEWADQRVRNLAAPGEGGDGSVVFVVMAQEIPGAAMPSETETVGIADTSSVFAKRSRVGIGYDRKQNAVAVARPFLRHAQERGQGNGSGPRLAIAAADWYTVGKAAAALPAPAFPESAAPLPLIDGWVHPQLHTHHENMHIKVDRDVLLQEYPVTAGYVAAD